MNPDQLDFALRRGPADVVRRLAQAAENERRAASSVALQWHKALWADFLASSINGVSRDTLWKTIPLALLGTATLGELQKAKLDVVTEHDLALEVLRDRRPEWLQPWAQWALGANFRSWPFVRAMERGGLIDKPVGEAYVLGLIAAAARHGAYHLLDSDRDLLDIVEQLFEVEGAGECSLAAFDKYTHVDSQWSSALLRLSREGRLSRGWLLQSSLSALHRGFAAFRAGWFSRFYEALGPTPEERVATLPKVYPLLGSPVPATVSFALKILTQCGKEQALATDRLLEALEPVWMLAQKGPVMSALKLLAQTPPGPAWLPHLSQAATHPSAEVQREVLRLLKTAWPVPEGSWRQRYTEILPSLEPSVQGDWGRWLGESVSLEPLALEASPPLLNQGPAPVQACQSLDEVFDLAARLLEELHPPHQIERLLDGLTRYVGRDSPRAPALSKRVRGRIKVEGLRGHLAALVACWLGDKPSAVPIAEPGHLETFLRRRLEEIRSALLGGKGFPRGLHSLPDDEAGFLSARSLARRLRAQPDPLPWDFTQALLRLRPGDSLGLTEELRGIPGQAAQALLLAVGASAKRPIFFSLASWWTAAENIRDAEQALTWSFEVEVSSHTHAGKTYHHRTFELLWKSAAADAVVWRDGTHERHSLEWQAFISPARLERFQLLGIREIANNIDWWEADWSDIVYLETLLVWTRAWGRTTTFLAALGLACKEAGQRGVSIDAVGQALQRGLLSPFLLGEVMAEVSSTGMITTKRWATSFQELRRFTAPEALFEALQSFLASVGQDVEIRPIMEPLLEIATSLKRPVRDERARKTLSALGKAGKAGKQAFSVLALT